MRIPLLEWIISKPFLFFIFTHNKSLFSSISSISHDCHPLSPLNLLTRRDHICRRKTLTPTFPPCSHSPGSSARSTPTSPSRTPRQISKVSLCSIYLLVLDWKGHVLFVDTKGHNFRNQFAGKFWKIKSPSRVSKLLLYNFIEQEAYPPKQTDLSTLPIA